MKVIIGHTSADFDCLASMIAAKKLNPTALLVFPGAIEENVRKFILLYENILNISSLKQIDLSEITDLIVVDTRQRDRIGIFESLIKKEKINIIVYDHHPPSDNEIGSNHSIIEQAGATTTLLLKEIIREKINISSLEATIFALGIYEDTGSLTFSTTTKDDIDVLAKLFSIGVDLRTVNRFTNIGLNSVQKKLLNYLISSEQEYYFKNVQVVFAEYRSDEYIEGLALVTHKLIEILNSDIIFVLVEMNNRIYIVGRSNRSSVNVGEILKGIGGGGHSQAASAVVRKLTLEETVQKIKNLIEKKIKPETLASDIMTTPVKTIETDTTIEEASRIMLRYGHNGFPVMDHGRLVGIITRQEIYKAKHHHYEKETVNVYMSEDIINVQMDTPILEVQELMIKYDVGRVLVLNHKGKLAGIITRTDLIRSLYGEKEIIEESYSLFEKKNHYYQIGKEGIRKLIYEYFSNEILEVLGYIGKIGDQLGFSVFMVGGIVRDLFLDIPNYDLDIVVEEDAIQFAQYFSKDLKGKIRCHQKFKTAVVILPNGIKIDFASARREFYEFPAALPQVEFASIKKDLYRRDFTINAMAIQLNQKKFALLLDFYGGKRDLEQRKIRILYSLSFTEDPARIIRAIRFEQRYGFSLESSTEKFLKKAVKEGLVSKIRKKRLSEELHIILNEKKPMKVLSRLNELGVLKGIIPGLEFTSFLIKKLNQVEAMVKLWKKKFPKEIIHKSVLYIFYLLELSPINLTQISKKINISAKDRVILEVLLKEKNKALYYLGNQKLAPSHIFHFLKDKPNEYLFVIYLEYFKNSHFRNIIQKYINTIRKTKIYINGHDLLALGMKPSPIYAKILRLVLYLQMNGLLMNRKAEITFIKKLNKKGII